MSSSQALLDIPKRLSLSALAADSIRKAIKDSVWKEYLPSERRLCELFKVSRPTIRMSLRMLAKEGLLEIHQGRRHRLLSSPPRPKQQQSRLIGLITQDSIEDLPVSAYQGLSEMRTRLAEQGFSTEIVFCQAHSVRAQRHKLEEFIRQNHVFCCVLFSVSKQLQQWFHEKSLPALVVGSCHPEVRLPSLDVDYRSVCRHAAGVLLRKGHRRIAFVVPNSGVAGDLASEKGFMEGMEQRGLPDNVSPAIVRHNGTAKSINSQLDTLFGSSHPPTALFVARPQYTFVVIMYLLKRGLTMPDTVSLIARDHDPFFENVSPLLAHYSFKLDAYEHRLSRLMLKMVHQGYLDPEPNLIFPEFFEGGTIKKLTS